MSHFEPGACVSLWQTDQCAWIVEYIWRWSDLLQRGILISLALMLAYTFFVLIRFFRCYFRVRFEFRSLQQQDSRDLDTQKRKLIPDLSLGLGILKAIGSAAPFLGLAGTSYGILAEFYGFGMSAGSVIAYLLRATPLTLVTAAAGMLVAVPAVVIHNLLRARVEKMRRELLVVSQAEDPIARRFRRAQTLPLGLRFSGLPPYPLVAAPVFASVVIIYMLFRPYVPVGLHVRVLPIGEFVEYHSLSQPIVVSMIETQFGEYLVRVNAKKISVDDFKQVLTEKLEDGEQRRVYVEAERTLAWGSIANIIDQAKNLNCEVVLLTTLPSKDARCAWPAAPTQDSHCRP